jgi:ribonucleoside-diphosphate reductase subunit M1
MSNIITFIIAIKTTDLDSLLAETAAYLNILHPDYGKLAARVAVTNLRKETSDNFMDVINKLYHYYDSNGKSTEMFIKFD